MLGESITSTVEQLWNKGLPNDLPKAELQQLVQRFGNRGALARRGDLRSARWGSPVLQVVDDANG